eukprot:1156924-Pelagomonas_calceolata.AAC.8
MCEAGLCDRGSLDRDSVKRGSVKEDWWGKEREREREREREVGGKGVREASVEVARVKVKRREKLNREACEEVKREASDQIGGSKTHKRRQSKHLNSQPKQEAASPEDVGRREYKQGVLKYAPMPAETCLPARPLPRLACLKIVHPYLHDLR